VFYSNLTDLYLDNFEFKDCRKWDVKNFLKNIKESYSNLCTGLERHWGFQKVEAPRFLGNRQKDGKVVSPTHRSHLAPPPPGNIPGTNFW